VLYPWRSLNLLTTSSATSSATDAALAAAERHDVAVLAWAQCHENPVLRRRLALLGEIEHLRFLRKALMPNWVTEE